MEEFGYAFDDSPTQMPTQQLIQTLTDNDELRAMRSTLATGEDGLQRLVRYKKPGHGEGFKDFARMLRDEGLELDKNFVKHMADNYRASQIYNVGDLRMVVATDVLDSTLLRLNFFLREEALWNELTRAGITQEPFEGGRDGLSYQRMCHVYKRLEQNSKSCLNVSRWISYAMEYAEQRYLAELGPETITPWEFRLELWDYVTLKKMESGRNRTAHVFSSCLEQHRSTLQVRCLTNRPERDMTKEKQEKLIRQLDDLTECPEVYADQKRTFALQVQFLKGCLIRNWTPAQPMGPPAILTAADSMRPRGV